MCGTNVQDLDIQTVALFIGEFVVISRRGLQDEALEAKIAAKKVAIAQNIDDCEIQKLGRCCDIGRLYETFYRFRNQNPSQ